MKKFLIIGNINAITYKEIFPLINENKMLLGQNTKGGTRKGNTLVFTTPNKKEKQASSWWYTNMDCQRQNQHLDLYKTYNETDYPKYDNYDAININRSADIPRDYDGEMGVPISFLNKLNRNQFEITGIMTSCDKGQPYVNGKLKFTRLVIRRKKE